MNHYTDSLAIPDDIARYPEYLIIDSFQIARPFKQRLLEIIRLLYPNKEDDQRLLLPSGTPTEQRFTIKWIAQQWFEEINYQIFAVFATDFIAYSQQLAALPTIDRLLFSSPLIYNRALLDELRATITRYAVTLYFTIREQGFFELLSRVEYALYHPAEDGLMLYRGHYTFMQDGIVL